MDYKYEYEYGFKDNLFSALGIFLVFAWAIVAHFSISICDYARKLFKTRR